MAEVLIETEETIIGIEAEEGKKLCGIDEAGRGSLAGPLVVAAVVLKKKINGLKDSKKLTAKKRDELFYKIISSSEYKIIFTNNKTIDKIGLSKALRNSLKEIKNHFYGYDILMDGNTNFEVKGIRWMIKADDKVPEVSAASILAKVSRDKYMLQISKNYPKYSFEKNKGYGTKEHIQMIQKYGYSNLHRKSFYIKKLHQEVLF